MKTGAFRVVVLLLALGVLATAGGWVLREIDTAIRRELRRL